MFTMCHYQLEVTLTDVNCHIMQTFYTTANYTHRCTHDDDTQAIQILFQLYIDTTQNFDIPNVFILAVEMGRCYLAESTTC